MKQRQGVNFLCVSCLWHIFSYPCPSNLKKSIIQDQLKGSGWEALSLQLVSINCAIWPSITLPKWLHLAVAEGLEMKLQWESPPLSERVSFKVLKYLGLLFTVWIKGCLFGKEKMRLMFLGYLASELWPPTLNSKTTVNLVGWKKGQRGRK